MKILIDENLPRRIVAHLNGHQCQTVAQCGWAGKKNGELLSLAEQSFDVLLTLDKSIPHQQGLAPDGLAILILHARSNRIHDLLPIIPECLAVLKIIRPGEIVRVGNRPR